MNTIKNNLKGILGIVLVTVLFTACKDVVPLTDQEQRTIDLSGTWVITSVQIDGLDATANYPGFKIDLQKNGLYSSINGGRVFRPTGTWRWVDTETTTELQLDVFTDVTITSFVIEDNAPEAMTWTFNYAIGGVRAGTNGNYIVTFEKL